MRRIVTEQPPRMHWYPHTTVATIVERDGHFLLVREKADGGIVFNQPAGHLDEGETLAEAAVRETLEETRWEVRLTGFSGIYQYCSPRNGVTYIRHCFTAAPVSEHTERDLDDGILDTHWLSLAEIREFGASGALRSPMVLDCIEDYLRGSRYSLDLIRNISD